jgi:putative methionine-R-sulfoxide reductase with GAF domain
MIVLVRMASDARIVGLIDIESERIDAFSGANRAMIESCAGSLAPLWKPESAST